jgi:hypothetical protein
MTRLRQPHIDAHQFDIDQGETNAPVVRRPRSGTHGFIWNGGTCELLPMIFDKDDPGYEANADMIRAAIRRWNGGTSK